MSSIQETLTAIGLDEKQAELYTLLVELGTSTVPTILERSSHSRTTIYDILTDLMALDYVTYEKKGREAFYTAVHPNKLYALLEEKKRNISLLEQEVTSSVRSLTGLYNLAHSKPGVRFFEGEEGIKEAYESILELRAPIDSIEDGGEMVEFIPEYVKEFVKKRIKRNIYNRVIAPSSTTLNITNESELRTSKTIPVEKFPFSMDIKICSNVVLFVTLKEETAVAIRIDDPTIANNFRIIFEFFWRHAARENTAS